MKDCEKTKDYPLEDRKNVVEYIQINSVFLGKITIALRDLRCYHTRKWRGKYA